LHLWSILTLLLSLDKVISDCDDGLPTLSKVTINLGFLLLFVNNYWIQSTLWLHLLDLINDLLLLLVLQLVVRLLSINWSSDYMTLIF
jgi:hypothetical protein